MIYIDGHAVFPVKEDANLIAYQNSGDEDGWTYRVEPHTGGYAVAVYDADNEFCGYL